MKHKVSLNAILLLEGLEKNVEAGEEQRAAEMKIKKKNSALRSSAISASLR